MNLGVLDEPVEIWGARVEGLLERGVGVAGETLVFVFCEEGWHRLDNQIMRVKIESGVV